MGDCPGPRTETTTRRIMSYGGFRVKQLCRPLPIPPVHLPHACQLMVTMPAFQVAPEACPRETGVLFPEARSYWDPPSAADKR